MDLSDKANVGLNPIQAFMRVNMPTPYYNNTYKFVTFSLTDF